MANRAEPVAAYLDEKDDGTEFTNIGLLVEFVKGDYFVVRDHANNEERYDTDKLKKIKRMKWDSSESQEELL